MKRYPDIVLRILRPECLSTRLAGRVPPGAELHLYLGEPGNVVLRTERTVPDGELYGLILDALTSGAIEPVGTTSAAVQTRLAQAVGMPTPPVPPRTDGPRSPHLRLVR